MGDIFKKLGTFALKATGTYRLWEKWHVEWDRFKDNYLPDYSDYEGTLVTKQGPIQFLSVVYGNRGLGGVQVHVETTGTKNEYLWVVIAIAEADSPCQAITRVFVDDEKIQENGSKLAGTKRGDYVLIESTTGNHTSQPFPTLEAESAVWTAQHLMLGTCAIALRFTWNQNVFSGLPKVRVEINGMIIPSLDAPENEGFNVYSENPAVHLFDYMTNPIYGKGLSKQDGVDLDLASFIAARDYGDELVTPFVGASANHVRFRAGAVLPSGKKIVDNIKSILQSMRGSIPYSSGLFYLKVEKHYLPADYGATAYFNFNPSNIVKSWSLSSGDLNTRYNKVKATFPNEDIEFKADFVVAESEVFRKEDDWELRETSIDLPNITNIYRAYEVAKVLLRKSRQQISARFIAMPEAIEVASGDIVTVTHPTPGWVDKQFRAVNIQLMDDGLVDVTLVEHEAGMYDASLPNEYLASPDTNLPDPTVVAAPTTLTLVSDETVMIKAHDGTLVARIHASWDVPLDIFIIGYTVQFKLSSDLNWIPAGSTNSASSVEVFIPNVVEGVNYDVRVRAENSAGFSSAWLESLNHTVVGKTSPPSNVTSISSYLRDNSYTLKWPAVTDIDLKEYEVRSGGTDWATSSYVATLRATEYVIGYLLAGDTIYRVKAVDTSGNYSTLEATHTITIAGAAAPVITYSYADSAIVLNWAEVSGTLSTKNYKVEINHPVSGLSTLGYTDGTSFAVTTNWTGSATFYVTALDVAGNSGTQGSVIAALAAPAAPTVAVEFKGTNVYLSWGEVSGDLPTKQYKVEVNDPQAGLTTIGYVDVTHFTYKVGWAGSATFYVTAIDVAGNLGAQGSVLAGVTLPSDPVMNPAVFVNDSIRISWSQSVGTFLTKNYTISVYNPQTLQTTEVAVIDANTFDYKADWHGTGTFYVQAKDILDNVGNTVSQNVTVLVPATPSVANATDGSNLVLSWSDAKTSLPIEYYDIRYQDGTSNNFATAVKLAQIKTTSYAFPLNSTVQRNYMVQAVDVAGFVSLVGEALVTPTAPGLLTVNSASVSGSNVILSWNDPATDLPIVEYVVRRGSSWSTGVEVARTKSLSHTVNGDWSGATTFWIAPVDSAMDIMNRSAGTLTYYGTPVSVVATLNPPDQISAISYGFSEGQMDLTWGEPTSNLPIVGYKITRGVARTVIAEIKTTSYSLIPDWSGSENFYVQAINSAGSLGAEQVIAAIVTVPNAPTINPYTLPSDRVEFSWGYPVGSNDYAGSLPVTSYDIRYDSGTGTWASATKILVTGTDAFSRKVDWANGRRFWVTPIDSSGNYGTSATTTVTISPPVGVSITPQVVDNNVLLSWSDAKATMPIAYYEVRRGAVYATAEVVGNISSQFTILFETVAGDFTYWITGVDTANNLGVNTKTTVAVSEPPDYVLYGTASDTGFTGTKTNAFVNSEGNLNLPVNTTETIADHFVNNAWTTPNDQVVAGFPIYIEPTPATATYVRQWDLGTALSNLSVTFDITATVIDGNITLSTTAASRWEMMISTSVDGIVWTDYPANSFKVFAPNFRYIKVTVTVTTDTGDDLLEISDIRYTIDIKEKTDAGTDVAVSSDDSKVFSGSVTGNFTDDESVTQSTTGATGTFLWEANGKYYIKVTSGTFSSSDTITGSLSSAVLTPTSVATTGGTPVRFNKSFADVSSLVITPKYDSVNPNILGIYDFLDEPNPKGLFVYLLDGSTGARQSGNFSWNARGH